MALDYGTKKIGLATTDPLQLIASPLDTIKTSEIFQFFDRYLQVEHVDCLVVGQPVHKDGNPTFLEPHIVVSYVNFKKSIQKLKLHVKTNSSVHKWRKKSSKKQFTKRRTGKIKAW